MYLALSGARIGLGDAMAAGLVTHAWRSDDFDAVIEALARGEARRQGDRAAIAEETEPGPLAEHRRRIDTIFGGRHRWKRSWSGWTATAAILHAQTAPDHPQPCRPHR